MAVPLRKLSVSSHDENILECKNRIISLCLSVLFPEPLLMHQSIQQISMTNGVDDKGPTLERVSSSTTRPMAWSVGYGAGSGRIACRYPSLFGGVERRREEDIMLNSSP